MGSDPILTVDQFKQLVTNGAMESSNLNNAIMRWIKANGKLVPDSEWNDTTAFKKQIQNQGVSRFGNAEKLYDLKAYAN